MVRKGQKKRISKKKAQDFELVKEELPDNLKNGEILCETLYLTVDPYMRMEEFRENIQLGSCMIGETISKGMLFIQVSDTGPLCLLFHCGVIISENPKYPIGTIIRSHSGWRSYIHIKNAPTKPGQHGLATLVRMPEMGQLSNTLALGVMGMPGMTAFFGFLEICQPKEGETVLVNKAAGAVGSLVGQIAKIKGLHLGDNDVKSCYKNLKNLNGRCKVIGFAGSDKKCKWVKDDLGFDEVFNYKKVKLDEAIKKAAPDGVDCLFDNVGADFTSTVLKHMKVFGRVSICGQISVYNTSEPPMGPYPFMTILGKQLKMEGFDVTRWIQKWPEGEKAMAQWIKEGKVSEILCETLYLTVDPYMRIEKFIENVQLGSCMIGETISKGMLFIQVSDTGPLCLLFHCGVIISENPKYPIGTIIRSHSGWRSYIHIKNAPTKPGQHGLATLVRMPEMGQLSNTLALGVMGMPGMTAFFGFLEICQPKEGETVLVNKAAGAVGSLVGQIAKIKGCKVIGFAGSDKKCKWVKDDLGFDEVFNYQKVNLDEAIKKAAPDGVDCLFDNVGADFTSTVLKHMKVFGRVSICGQISVYNTSEPPIGPYPFMTILGKQLKMEGFDVTRWIQKWPEGEKAMAQWIKEGKIRYRETFTKGFENIPKAFIELFEGENTGKAIIIA